MELLGLYASLIFSIFGAATSTFLAMFIVFGVAVAFLIAEGNKNNKISNFQRNIARVAIFVAAWALITNQIASVYSDNDLEETYECSQNTEYSNIYFDNNMTIEVTTLKSKYGYGIESQDVNISLNGCN